MIPHSPLTSFHTVLTLRLSALLNRQTDGLATDKRRVAPSSTILVTYSRPGGSGNSQTDMTLLALPPPLMNFNMAFASQLPPSTST